MLADTTPSAGRYVHRRGEALFAGICALLLAWPCSALVRDNALRVRLLRALFNGTPIDEYTRIRAAAGGDPAGTWMAGRNVWLLSGDARGAVAVWKRSPETNGERLSVVAGHEWWRGNEREALDCIRMALALQPGNGAFADTLGIWRTARKETVELYDDTAAVLAREPRNAAALAHHAAAAQLLGRTTKASADLERAFAIAPDDRVVLRKLSRFLIETGGDVARAERLLLQGDRRWPQDDFFYYQLAQLYASQKRYAEAEPYMQRLASLRRDDASAREVVGLYWYERGDYSAAADHYRAAVRLEPNEPRFRTRLADALGRARASSKEIAR